MSYSSISTVVRGFGFTVMLTLCIQCKKEQNSINQIGTESISTIASENLAASESMSQTRTATFLNNLNNFQQVYGDRNFPRARASDVSADDNIYTRSNKLTAIKDSTSSLTSRSVSSLALQGFGFSIPENATIENIILRVRRFKKGTPTVGDHTLSIMQRYNCEAGQPCRYGIFWTYRDTYPGKIYSNTEMENVYSQTGTGINGGFNHNEAYKWTPTMVNHQYFGVRIDNYAPIGKGSVEIYYDLVEVTIQYAVPI
jgi:hypothetical protein